MKRLKLTTLVLCAAMLASMTACSSESESKRSKRDSEEESTTIEETETEAEATEDTSFSETRETYVTWWCENCYTQGNDGKFCRECGEPAPECVLNGETQPEFTEPTVTLMTYETEEHETEAKNELKFGTQNPMPFNDPDTGLELYVKFHGVIKYDINEGEEIGEDYLKACVIDTMQVRMRNALEYGGYANITAYLLDVSRGTAYDLRQNLPISNVSISLEVTLDESCREAYEEARGN